jgi:SAM-dependent methyltransferase
MRRDLCQKLRCPQDGGAVDLVTREGTESVDSGELRCIENNSHRYPIRDGIPHFLDIDYDTLAKDEPVEYGSIVTPAVAKKCMTLRGGWSLDAGCARGAYRPFMPGRYVGVDLVRPFLLHAKHRFPEADFVAGDVRRLPFADNTFANVISSQVVEHLSIDDLANALAEFQRVSTGYIVVDTPNESKVLNWIRERVYGGPAAGMHDDSSPLAHHCRITPKLLRDYGFSLEGCVGHVSRNRFNWPPLWNAYDALASKLPAIGTNLIGVAQGSSEQATG